jgi:hypothetical protein
MPHPGSKSFSSQPALAPEHAVLHSYLFVLEIVDEQIEPGKALLKISGDRLTSVRRNHALDDVERSRAIDAAAFAVHGDRELGSCPALLQIRVAQRAHPENY